MNTNHEKGGINDDEGGTASQIEKGVEATCIKALQSSSWSSSFASLLLRGHDHVHELLLSSTY